MTTFAVTSVSSLFCQAPTCFRIGSKFRCIRPTATEMQSMSENDFECFASTGVNDRFWCNRFARAASSDPLRTSEVFPQYRSCLHRYTRSRACHLASRPCCELRPRIEHAHSRTFLVHCLDLID